MKIRQGFVSNSSSSSFVIVDTNLGNTLYEDGNSEMEQCGTIKISIDEFIKCLQKEKEKGATEVHLHYGGGYEG